MRNALCAGFFIVSVLSVQAADDSSCVSAPSRSCVLEMAAGAIRYAETSGDDPRKLYLSDVWAKAVDRNAFLAETWGTVINAAAKAGRTDLAIMVASAVDKRFSYAEIGDLVVALQLSGRQADLARLEPLLSYAKQGKLGVYNLRIGAAFVASGRASDFDQFVAPLRLSAYEIAAMQVAGRLMSGAADAISPLETLQGNDRVNAVTEALSVLRAGQRLETAAPLVAFRDLRTLDGVSDCGSIASAARDTSLAQRCLAAVSTLSPQDVKNAWFGGTVAPEVVGALAAAGDWQGALTLTRGLPRDSVKKAIFKMAQWSRSPELVPVVRKALAGSSPDFPGIERGDYIVRLLVMAGQTSEADEFVATASDDVTRDEWRRREAEALAESAAVAAVTVASTISDPASRARALAVISLRLP